MSARSTSSKVFRSLAFIALLLTAFTSTAESWHSHAKNAADSAKTCPICVSAHQRTASATSSAATLAPARTVTEMPAQAEQPGTLAPETLPLCVRPPPLAV